MIRAEAWTPSDGLQLEYGAHTAALEIERNVALTAGPGAGKTEVLAQRADFLLRTGSCRYPKRILAISFKVDASQNLRERVRLRCGLELAGRLDSQTFHAFAKRIIDRFRHVLKGVEALDPDYSIGRHRIQRRSITFDDMVPLAVSIIETSAIARNAVRQTYSHVFLDEFQDCTKAQYKLISACFLGTPARLTAVGDTKQRIMGWAGALDGIFKTYANDFDAYPLHLYQNFRSLPRLRRMQNAMVAVMDPIAAVKEEQLAGSEGEIEILPFADDAEEAAELAKRIRGWIEEDGVEPSDIAVLVSKQQNLYCEKMREALDAEHVPFREEDTSQDLAAEPVACLITDFLLVATGGRQPAAYRRLSDQIVFRHGLDDEHEYRVSFRWDEFVRETGRRIKAGEINLSDKNDLRSLVTTLIAGIGRDTVVALSADYAHGDRLNQQIGLVVDRIGTLLENGRDVSEALASFRGDRAVRVMSIHKSKGLEFDTVIVFGVENETFWGAADAERSAYFVAISRAKRRLVLSVCEARERPIGATRWTVSRTPQAEFLSYAQRYIT